MPYSTYDPSRRRFLLTGATAAGALLVGFGTAHQAERVDAATVVPVANGQVALNAWLKIDVNSVCTVMLARAEMGQAVSTTLPMLVAEELGADWGSIRTEAASLARVYANVAVVEDGLPVAPDAYLEGHWVAPVVRLARAALGTGASMLGVQVTGGSTSIRDAWLPMRTAGAAARMMLAQVAAERWRLLPSQIVVENGVARFPPENREVPIGTLVAAAGRMAIPSDVALKPRARFTLLGTSPRRLDGPAKVTGDAQFGLDARPEGLLYAAIKQVPAQGARLNTFDEAPALSMRGVERVVALDNAIAVVADSYWRAQKAVEAISLSHGPAPSDVVDSTQVMRVLEAALASDDGLVYESRGVIAPAGASIDVVEATYSVPYLAHACMEPMNCTARVTADGCELWVGHQSPSFAVGAAAGVLGISTDAVTLHQHFLGGGFGRRHESDVVRQAVTIAASMKGRAVQLVWAREEDTRHDMYRPAAMSTVRASLDGTGLPDWWHQRLASTSVASDFVGRVLEMNTLETPERTNVEGAAWRPYAINNMCVEHVPVDVAFPVGFWRSVGYSQNAFFFESFLDELAHKAGIEPLAYRLKLLDAHPRFQKVLTSAAAMLNWLPGQTSSVPGHGRGIALVESFGAIVAQAIEVRVMASKRMRIERIACAVDAGFAVHPDQLAAQMQSAIVYGLSAAVYGRIDFREGAVVQSNFHDYPVLRINELPDLQVNIVNGATRLDEAPGGGGESGTPPAAPALCNALFAATGERVRDLPLTGSGYSLA